MILTKQASRYSSRKLSDECKRDSVYLTDDNGSHRVVHFRTKNNIIQALRLADGNYYDVTGAEAKVYFDRYRFSSYLSCNSIEFKRKGLNDI
jgi:hypothetical protein